MKEIVRKRFQSWKSMFCWYTILYGGLLHADSPLTSSYFAPAYREVPEIAAMMAIEGQTEDALLLDALTSVFILDAERPIDVRLAMINAVGFGQNTNVELIVQYVALKYGSDAADWKREVAAGTWVTLSKKCELAGVTGEDMLVIAYVSAMAEYMNPRCALPFAAKAGLALREHEAHAWITQLIMAQMIMEINPCEVFVMFAELPKKVMSEGRLREEAKRRIMDYIGLYEDACRPDEYSDAYYSIFPVFDTLQNVQKFNTARYVDLHFVGDVEGVLPVMDFVDNRGEEGGKVLVEIRNSGNTMNIPTNLYCVMYVMVDGSEERLVRQIQIPGIKANQSQILAVFLPGLWWQEGAGRMELFIDQAEQIEERNETNNSVRMSP